MLLRIDNREPDHLKSLFQKELFKIEYKQLEAGDFEFVNSDGETVLLIERKDVDDLCASLVDGRFDEQKMKLSVCVSAAPKPYPIAYLIEGDFSKHEKKASIETIMLTTPFRDGFFILQSPGLKGTHDLIVRIAKLFEDGGMNPLSEDELYRRFISSRTAQRGGGGLFSKKDNWWIISLGQIPGIGPQAARSIGNMYPRVSDLIDAYAKCNNDEDRKVMLQNVKTGSRRIGVKASAIVWQTVVGGKGGGEEIQGVGEKTNKNPKAKPKAITKKKISNECLFTDDDNN